ncbi:MAG: membrane protein [Epsilonproteobacteria bacterium (ex Lamellibrachia satsuma)]|nr:MAG: membrane protein [Epsilonproteobacteria bacterium (ex Lamellibrachia satsuma)]
MIENGFTYLSALAMIAASIVYVEKKSTLKLFEYLPAIVIIYFTVMLFSTFGFWQKSTEITSTYKAVKSNLLPAMIFLMLLGADMREIFKLGKKMLLTFLLASISIALGFIITFALFHTAFETDAWKAFAALSGSWMGGTGNMVAIQGALDLSDSKMGYALLIDSIDYAIWVMILLALVPMAGRFNTWSRADTSLIDEVGQRLALKETTKKMDFTSLFLLLAMSLFVSALSQYAASFCPVTSFLTTTTWVVIIATIAGIIMAMTPLSKVPGSSEIGHILLYLIVALIASRANFAELTQAPLYIFAGFVIIAVHMGFMVLFAKLFKLDLFSLGVASLANIGGIASAPILASAYSKALIPIGVLMAMMGYILGTFGGLMVGKALEVIAG